MTQPTQDIIDKYWGWWDIGEISANCEFTPEFIEKYWGEWDLYNLAYNKSFNANLINKYLDKYKDVKLPKMMLYYTEEQKNIYNIFRNLSSNPNLTIEIIDKFWDKLDKDDLLDKDEGADEIKAYRRTKRD